MDQIESTAEKRLNIRYRAAMLPHILDLRLPGGGIDLNLVEEILIPLGLTDLNRAARIGRQMQWVGEYP